MAHMRHPNPSDTASSIQSALATAGKPTSSQSWSGAWAAAPHPLLTAFDSWALIGHLQREQWLKPPPPHGGAVTGSTAGEP